MNDIDIIKTARLMSHAGNNHDLAYEALERIEAQLKWISVKDRLPSSRGKYLVSLNCEDDGYSHSRYRYVAVVNFMMPSYWDEVRGTVEAWKLLPLPYKSESAKHMML